MSQIITAAPPPNTINVICGNGKALSDLICLSFIGVHYEADFDILMTKIFPGGPGFYIPEAIGLYWVDNKADSAYSYDATPNDSVPDYPNLDIWAVNQETAFGGDQFEIIGEELRQLFTEAYQIYLEKGLIERSGASYVIW